MEMKLLKGGIVHVEGIPFELAADVPVIGTPENMRMVVEQGLVERRYPSAGEAQSGT